MKKISCIIPAYNEEKEIGKILSVVIPLIGQHLHEVIDLPGDVRVDHEQVCSLGLEEVMADQ